MGKRHLNFSLVTFCILLVYFCLRVINIGYGSPGELEALYIKTGVGFIYQIFLIFGIGGVRVINVIFSLFCLYFIAKLTTEIADSLNWPKDTSKMAGVFALTLVGFSEQMAQYSRLATNQIPGLTFFTISVYLLIRASIKNKTEFVTKRLLAGALFGSISLLLNFDLIIPFFAIVIIILLFCKSLKKKSHKKLLIAYFAIPLILILLLVFTANGSYPKLTFINIQNFSLESILLFIQVFITNSWTSFAFWIVSIIANLFKRNKITLIALALTTTAIFIKNDLLIILILGVVTGISLLPAFGKKLAKLPVVIILTLYIITNFYNSQKYNYLWPDYSKAYKYLSVNLKNKDTLLAEEVSSILLPAKVVTFDEFTYKDLTGLDAYKSALIDGYFKYIELNEKDVDVSKSIELRKIILEEARGSYYKVYKDQYFTVYKLNF